MNQIPNNPQLTMPSYNRHQIQKFITIDIKVHSYYEPIRNLYCADVSIVLTTLTEEWTRNNNITGSMVYHLYQLQLNVYAYIITNGENVEQTTKTRILNILRLFQQNTIIRMRSYFLLFKENEYRFVFHFIRLKMTTIHVNANKYLKSSKKLPHYDKQQAWVLSIIKKRHMFKLIAVKLDFLKGK